MKNKKTNKLLIVGRSILLIVNIVCAAIELRTGNDHAAMWCILATVWMIISWMEKYFANKWEEFCDECMEGLDKAVSAYKLLKSKYDALVASMIPCAIESCQKEGTQK